MNAAAVYPSLVPCSAFQCHTMLVNDDTGGQFQSGKQTNEERACSRLDIYALVDRSTAAS